MPRPKGSKNKVKKVKVSAAVDFDAAVAEKESEKAAIAGEIAALNEKLAEVKAEVKAKKSALLSLDKEIAKLQKNKDAQAEKKAEEARKAELNDLLSSLLKEGLSSEEILSKLKG